MASITNRSRYTVSVTRRPELTRSFPHTAKARATEYCATLRAQGLKPKLRQGTDAWLVRIGSGRQRASFSARSLDEAQHTVNEIEAQRARGLMIDYIAARKITFAELVQRYIDEECPRHKGCDVERYTLGSFLDDAYDLAGRSRPLSRDARTPRRRLPAQQIQQTQSVVRQHALMHPAQLFNDHCRHTRSRPIESVASRLCSLCKPWAAVADFPGCSASFCRPRRSAQRGSLSAHRRIGIARAEAARPRTEPIRLLIQCPDGRASICILTIYWPNRTGTCTFNCTSGASAVSPMPRLVTNVVSLPNA